MASSISIPFWPSSLDCVSWSQDNWIAVVGGEDIAILTPRLQTPGLKRSPWETTIFKASGFTMAEVPLTTPLRSKVFSVGEELSLRQAISAKWSSPGIARHRGCALAVLNADHVLCIWAHEGIPTLKTNWQRHVIVNHAIRDYYADLDAGQKTGDERTQVERRQVQQRIKAFAWSRPLHQRSADNRLPRRLGWGTQFVAAATGGGHILFLKVESPQTGGLSHDSSWSVNVSGYFETPSVTPPLAQETDSTISLDYEKYTTATSIALSDWRHDDDLSSVLTLAYISRGKLFSVPVHAHMNGNTIEMKCPDQPQHHLQDRSDIRGPLQFTTTEESQSVVSFADNAVFHVDTSREAYPSNDNDFHHLDGRWDEISGFTFTTTAESSIRLHFASLITSHSATTATLPLPLQSSNDDTEPEPLWRHALNASKTAFSSQHGLEGHVSVRTCGIASAPLGDYVVTCATLHPSDSNAYVISSDQASSLNITPEHQMLENSFLPSPRPFVSVETVLFSLQRQIEARRLADQPKEVDRDAILEDVSQHLPFGAFDSKFRIDDNSQITNVDAEGQLHLLRHAMYADPEMRAARAARIVDMAMNTDRRRAEVMRVIIQQLLNAVLRLPTTVVHMDGVSLTVKTIYDAISSKLITGNQSGISETPTRNRSEDCKICQQSIPFESLKWAKCSNGHQFSRCAMSFLALQEPGITKVCGLCGLQYLNEGVLPATSGEDMEMADILETEGGQSVPGADAWVEISHNESATKTHKPTLVQLLFAACDICIYCGGKFTDER